jgi:hypothetical protein
MVIDNDNKAVTVQYAESAERARIATFQAEVEKLAAGLPWDVATKSVPLSEEQMRATLSGILEDRDTWAERLGIDDITSVGSLTPTVAEIRTSQSDPPQTDLTINGLLINLVGDSRPEYLVSQ